MKRRVVVTGLGALTPLGVGVAETWEGLLAGASGIGPLTRFPPGDMPSTIVGEVPEFEVDDYLPRKLVRHLDRFTVLGLLAGIEAMRDCGLEITDANAERIGVSVGSGIGGIVSIETGTQVCLERGPKRMSPFHIPMSIVNMVSGNLSIHLGLKGPSLSVATACSTAAHSLGEAARLIEYGDADVMLAGGSEAAISPTSLGGFAAARALSCRNDAPEQASRPWDAGRDGFVLAEGAGVLVLEEYEHAKGRDAKIYAELSGFGMSSDAHHITSPPEDGNGAARCMQMAMRHAGLNPDDIQYLNAHGTSTPLGDVVETRAVKTVFGAQAKRLAISSNKSMIGHLLGASGGVESVATVLSLHHQVVPPTINLEQPGEGCDLDYVPGTAREMPLSAALNNSFGFGGTNATLAFRRS